MIKIIFFNFKAQAKVRFIYRIITPDRVFLLILIEFHLCI